MNTQHFNVMYGQDYQEKLRGIVNEDPFNMQLIDNFFLFGTEKKTYQLKNGRVLQVRAQTDCYSYCNHLTIFPSKKDYDIWKHNDRLCEQDPEGRGGRNSIGQKIMWVVLWMKQHPDELVPTKYDDCPELWHYDYHCSKCLEGKELHKEEVNATKSN